MPPNEYEVAIPNRQFPMVAAPLIVMMSVTKMPVIIAVGLFYKKFILI